MLPVSCATVLMVSVSCRGDRPCGSVPEGSARGHGRVVRQPEHLLSDGVPLDLRRACSDRRGPGGQETGQPPAALDRMLGLPGDQALGTEHVHGELVQVLLEGTDRSEEHTSELQSLMRISSAVFCMKKNKKNKTI